MEGSKVQRMIQNTKDNWRLCCLTLHSNGTLWVFIDSVAAKSMHRPVRSSNSPMDGPMGNGPIDEWMDGSMDGSTEGPFVHSTGFRSAGGIPK
jgi:hypothetical protein